MRDLLDIFVAWPMPALWLALAGAVLVFARPRAGRLLVVATALLFALSAMPVVARCLIGGLSGATIGVDGAAAAPPAVAAIVVPTAGSYDDVRGVWRSRDQTVRRVVLGDVVARNWGLPLLVAGGAPNGIEPPEAETVTRALGLRDAIVLPTPSNTDETGRAVAAGLDANGIARNVVVVTDTAHIARMNAALRRAGVTVVGAISASGEDAKTGRNRAVVAGDFVPRRSTLVVTAAALHEYIAIAVYLARGNIGTGDL